MAHGGGASVDLIDETFIVAEPAAVAAAFRDRALWAEWWPDLDLAVFQDRDEAGIRWTVTGALVGSSEVWVEPWKDGVIVHFYLRTTITAPGSATHPLDGPPKRLLRRAVKEREARALHHKRCVNALKDRLEQGRPAGRPRVGAAPGPVPPAG